MIGYCPSAGRIQPRHLLSFSTYSTAIAQVANALSHNTRIVSLPLSRSPYRFLSLPSPPPHSHSLSFSLPHFFSVLFTATRDIHLSRVVRFGIDAAADIGRGEREKKIGRHGRETVSTQGRATARSDRFIAVIADGRLRTPRFFSSLFAGSRPLSTTLSNRNPRPSS